MSTYLITGVSRGIGFEFLRQISQDPANTIIGLVRDKVSTDKKIVSELGERENVHIVQGDLSKYDELKASVAETSEITGGSLDYIIANAAFISDWSGLASFSVLGEMPQELEDDLVDSFKTNVVGNVHLFNLYMPLILNGRVKKVITISSGLADADVTAKHGFSDGGPYAASKAAMNLVVAKYSAEYSEKGVLFLSISPGMVDTGKYNNIPPEVGQKLQAMITKFTAYAPSFKGPISTEESVKAVLAVTNKASLENGDGGAFLSHHGNKEWL
ncbi:Fc.00g116240.m01.CDS01 [Cosmosporella sp. VM-42]